MTPSQKQVNLEMAAQILKTLAHPVRLKIIQNLGRYGQLSPTTIQQHLSLTNAGLSTHLMKMTNRHILQRSRKGRETYYSLTDPNLIDLLNSLLHINPDINC